MSTIIVDNVRAWEADIDHITRGPLGAFGEDGDRPAGVVGGEPTVTAAGAAGTVAAAALTTIHDDSIADLSSPYVSGLLDVVKSLSSTTSSQPILPVHRIRGLLRQSGLLEAEDRHTGPPLSAQQRRQTSEFGTDDDDDDDVDDDDYSQAEARLQEQKRRRHDHSGDLGGDARRGPVASEVEWLLVSKATVQVYGVLLNTLLEQIIPLHDDIWYWDDILASYTSLSLYTVQTSPLRFWSWAKEMGQIVCESRVQFSILQQQLELRQRQRHTTTAEAMVAARPEEGAASALSRKWQQFYRLVRRGVAARSFSDLERRLLSPVARCRADARLSQKRLKQVRQLVASGLGILIDEGLRFDLDEGADVKDIMADNGRRWKGVVERSVSLMDQVTTDVLAVDSSILEFEDKVFNDVQVDPILTAKDGFGFDSNKPSQLARRLDRLLAQGIPHLVGSLRLVVAADGRPSPLVRYWLPAGLLLLSSSTLLRIVSSRKADIVQWIRDLGRTARDFWFNWVVEPVAKVVGTIRHDANSEIAIMSRDSLRADRDSLERMVVEFALDRPELVGPAGGNGGGALSEADVAAIRARVHEGDVTPVLRAYESGLRKPLQGAVRGDLVRSLLIQVQKTKVDLEVAISGIDALLKSQELVFGFVGLTPGVLVSVGVLQYLRGVLGGRRGLRRGRRAGRCVRVLRNMDRIFCDASTDPATLNGILSYKHRGLLVCEVHVLRNVTRGLFPSDVDKEFLEDMDEVLNAKTVEKQRQALDRVRWAYAKWLQ